MSLFTQLEKKEKKPSFQRRQVGYLLSKEGEFRKGENFTQNSSKKLHNFSVKFCTFFK